MSRMLLAALLVPAAAVAGPSVEVNNTTANPVPVTVTNPGGQVQVTNTPSVTVTNPVQVTGSVQVSNTPAVTINGTPTVNVANQPGVGTLYSEVFSISTGANGGSIAATPGTAVPAGTRRTINTASASWTCDKGKGAMVELFLGLPAGVANNGSVLGGQGAVFMSGQLAYGTASRDTYAATQSLNLTVPPQGTVTPIASFDFNSNCLVTVWLFGVETPSSP